MRLKTGETSKEGGNDKQGRRKRLEEIPQRHRHSQWDRILELYKYRDEDGAIQLSDNQPERSFFFTEKLEFFIGQRQRNSSFCLPRIARKFSENI